MEYIKRHWRGELSLPRSYWLNGFLLTFLVLLISKLVLDPLLVGMGQRREIEDIILTVVIFDAFLVVLSTWQVVGIWRSANAYRTMYLDEPKRHWATVAQFLCVLGILRAGAMIIQEAEAISSLAKMLR